MDISKESSVKPRSLKLTEDWTAVLIGAGIIAVSLLGVSLKAPIYAWDTFEILGGLLQDGQNLRHLQGQFLVVVCGVVLSAIFLRINISRALGAFLFVFLLTQLATILGGFKLAQEFNFEAVIFCLAFGLLVGNLFTLPEWLRKSLTTELFVKIGLVLLGASVIFSDILKAGGLGLIQALVVVLSVWYFSFWLCKKFKVDDELTMMISSAVSICGVSAAIATAGAIKGDPKKLSYVISMVLIIAVPMMLLMPPAAHWLGLSEEVAGAWLGGSIDTSGAVVASGSLVGETALKVSTIVKFSQNVLLGIAAFAISVYWTYTKSPEGNDTSQKPSLGVIWERFPKFVVGFVAASLVFSFLVPEATYQEVKGGLKGLQSLWFALAFTSIGLETKFKDLFAFDNQKPLWVFLVAQGFNIIVTLVVAKLLFGYYAG